MGTRADFYEGRGTEAKWLGSIAWDGNPGGIDNTILKAQQPTTFRLAVRKFLAERDDSTTPDQGWPWPWDDSRTTDYAYALDDGRVWASCFGTEWFDPLKPQPEDGPEDKTAVFPNMAERKNVAWDKRSGIMLIQAPEKKE